MDEHNFKTHIINTPELLGQLFNYVERLGSDYLVLDVETDSKFEKKANLYGVGVCFNDKEAFYIPWKNEPENGVSAYTWDESNRKLIKEWLINTCKTHKLIGHNISYDVLVLEYTFGVDFTPFIYSDTILQKHTLKEIPPFALKDVAVEYLGHWANKAQKTLEDEVIAKGGRWTKDEKDMYMATTATLGEYCCWDVMLTFLLFQMFETRLENEGLKQLFYSDEVMPLYKEVTINMKRQGLEIDVDYFEKLKTDISKEINDIESKIMSQLRALPDIRNFEQNLLNDKIPVRRTGDYPKVLAEVLGVPLPINKKTGKVTLSAKALEKQAEATPEHNNFYDWIKDKESDPTINTFDKAQLREAQENIFFKRNPDQKYLFNLKSGKQLIVLFCDIWGYKPPNKTDGGQPKIDAEFLESIQDEKPTIAQLLQYKKLIKLLTTYIEGILDREVDGRIYASLLQFGTTSGRYACRNPNLQNLPRPREDVDANDVVMKYTNAIRAGFVAGKGNKIVDADYSALEPRCFAHVSGDERLRDVFRKGEDLYSRIAIDVFKLDGVSADPNDPNYLGKVNKEYRQKTKVFCLAVVYGAEAPRISKAMNVSKGEANQIIRSYLNAYPNLKKYMKDCDLEAKSNGLVSTEFGRVRHLPEAKAIWALYGDDIVDWRWAKKRNLIDKRRVYKTSLNNSKNFKIQGLAGHVINRAMIEIAKELKQRNLKSYIGLMVHDQVICVCPEHEVAEVVDIVRDKMENTTKISIPLIAEPEVADNMKESH